MRVLFVSKSIHDVSGAGVGSRMHLNVLKKLVGKENVYVSGIDCPAWSNSWKLCRTDAGRTSRGSRILCGISALFFCAFNCIYKHSTDRSGDIGKFV